MSSRSVLSSASPWTPFEDWSPKLLKAKVYEQILLDIILGDLPPGGRLDEAALVKRYGAGLAGVRDALARLALEGLVVRRARAGTTVAPIDLVDVRQAIDARRLIEPHCAALAAAHASSEDIAALRAAFDDADRAIKARDIRAIVDMDQRFHVAMARACRNATLARILIPLQHKATRFWVYSMKEDTPDEQWEEVRRHLRIVDLIAAHDADGARAAVVAILSEFTQTAKRAANAV